MAGRSSPFTPELWAQIIERTEEGEYLRPICRDLGIGKSTAYDWMEADPILKAQYKAARAEGWDVIAQRTRDTARGKGDSTQDVARDKLIIDTDLKMLSKWYPGKYGDKQQIEHTGAEGGPIQVTRIERVVLDPK